MEVMMLRMLALVFCAALGLAPVGAAQAVPSLRRGALVRIVLPAQGGAPEQRFSGTLIRLQDDTVLIERGGGFALPESSSIALDQGGRLEFLQARHSYGGTGAVLGALFGGAFGAAVGASSGQGTVVGPEAGAVGGGVLGAAAGVLLGLIVGSSIHSDTWVPVHATGVHVAVTPGRVGISLSW